MEYIKCPYCDYEYHIAEIFLPNTVVGKFDLVSRDELGKIHDVINDTTSMVEKYVCDNCNKQFEVTIVPTYNTKKLEKVDFPNLNTL